MQQKGFILHIPSRYNSVEEAKKELDSKLEKYIAEQGKFYLVSTVSEYVANSYDYAKNHKKTNFVNKIIAEYAVLGETSDSYLNQLIESVINYGKN